MNALSLQEAAEVIRGNGVLVYPTETFYAIGGNALSNEAVAVVYRAKHRDKLYPLPIIVGDLSQLRMATACPEHSYPMELAEAFWPGPLTILFPASPTLPSLLTGGTGKVAIRLSSHPGARALCLAAGVPLISSSANLSRRNPVTNINELDPALLEAIGGTVYDIEPQPAGGAPSTIVEVAEAADGNKYVHILRAGAIVPHQFAALGFACHVK